MTWLTKLAELEQRSHRYAEAKAHIQEAIKYQRAIKNVDSWSLLMQLGLLVSLCGSLKDAETGYPAAREIHDILAARARDPNYNHAEDNRVYWHLVHFYENVGDDKMFVDSCEHVKHDLMTEDTPARGETRKHYLAALAKLQREGTAH